MPGAARTSRGEASARNKNVSGHAVPRMAAPPETPDPVPPWGRRVLLAVVLGGALYLGLALLADARELASVLRRLDPRFLALALGLVMASLAVRSVRWALYRHRLGVRDRFPHNLLLGVPQGRTGLVAKAQHLRERGVRYGLAIPAVVAERTAEIVAIGLVMLALLPFGPRATWPLLLVGIALAVAYGVLVRHPPLVEPLLKRLEKWHVAQHRAHDVRLALAELPPLLGGRLLAGALALSAVGLVLEGSAALALAVGLGLKLTAGQALFAYFAGTVAGLVSLLPGGILAAEGGMIGVLLAMGLPLPQATALTLATRACTLWFSLALGVGAALAVPARGE